MATRRGGALRVGGFGLVSAALVFASCAAAAKVTPGNAVSDSFSALGKQSALTFRFSVPLTASQWQQVSETGGGKGLSAAAAQALSQGSIFFATETGHGEALDSTQAKSDASNSYDLGLQVGSATPIEFLYVNETAYLKVDISGLLASVGETSTSASKIQTTLDKLNTYVPGISALAQGGWVSVSKASLQPLESMLKQAESSLGSSSTSSTNLFKEIGTKLRSDLINAFKSNVTYQDLGTSGGRTEYSITLAVQAFVQAAGTALTTDLSSIPGLPSGFATTIKSDLSKVTAKIPAGQTAVADLYVQGGLASELDVDVNQFLHTKYSFAVPLRLAIQPSATITAPSGATPLDLSKLPQLLGGLIGKLGALGGLGAGSSTSSSTG